MEKKCGLMWKCKFLFFPNTYLFEKLIREVAQKLIDKE